MKKIVLVSPAYPSPGRPIYVFVQQLVNTLIDLGIQVVVIAPQSLTHCILYKETVQPWHSTSMTDNGNVYEVYRPYSITLGDRIMWLQNLLERICNFFINHIIKKLSPDVIYCHFWSSAMRVLNLAHTKSIPLFVACGEGDDAMEILTSKLSNKDKELIRNVVTGVISVSSENKRKCIQYGLATLENVIVLPNCVDNTKFYNFECNDFRNSLGVNKDDFLILFVGSFTKRKGANRLAKAIEKLEDKKIKVVFIGKHLGSESVEPECRGIIYKGTQEHDKLPLFLNSSDAFVLPTLKEGCCNAIVEALSCGIPVISSDRPFNHDILNSRNSIMIDPDNIEDLSGAIYKLKNDKQLYNKIKQYAVENSSRYSIIQRAKNIIEFIEKFT